MSYMAAQVRATMPKNPHGKALIYPVSRWDNLMTWWPILGTGTWKWQLPSENAFRPTALGRKNYLFAGSDAGAQCSARFYFFFANCIHYNVDPFSWQEKVLGIIPHYPVNKLSELLPQKLDLYNALKSGYIINWQDGYLLRTQDQQLGKNRTTGVNTY